MIKGAFLIRGQDAQPAFEVAPDWESYEFTKLDPKSDKDRKFFESMLAWDRPIEIKGKEVRSSARVPRQIRTVCTNIHVLQCKWASGQVFV